jgi:hypothetical protein
MCVVWSGLAAYRYDSPLLCNLDYTIRRISADRFHFNCVGVDVAIQAWMDPWRRYAKIQQRWKERWKCSMQFIWTSRWPSLAFIVLIV